MMVEEEEGGDEGQRRPVPSVFVEPKSNVTFDDCIWDSLWYLRHTGDIRQFDNLGQPPPSAYSEQVSIISNLLYPVGPSNPNVVIKDSVFFNNTATTIISIQDGCLFLERTYFKSNEVIESIVQVTESSTKYDDEDSRLSCRPYDSSSSSVVYPSCFIDNYVTSAEAVVSVQTTPKLIADNLTDDESIPSWLQVMSQSYEGGTQTLVVDENSYVDDQVDLEEEEEDDSGDNQYCSGILVLVETVVEWDDNDDTCILMESSTQCDVESQLPSKYIGSDICPTQQLPIVNKPSKVSSSSSSAVAARAGTTAGLVTGSLMNLILFFWLISPAV